VTNDEARSTGLDYSSNCSRLVAYERGYTPDAHALHDILNRARVGAVTDHNAAATEPPN
jgi:hypothetical protein